MEKRSNNYLIILIVLLLVITVIAGAGLCYLSWSDGYKPGNGASLDKVQSSEGTLSSDQENPVGEKAEGTMDSEALEQAKEEGRQEVLDSIKEDMDANVSAEEILDELLKADGGTGEADEPVAETVTMEQIHISEDGEYAYIKDGNVLSHKGIDVSKYQKDIDWKKVAADGVEYAFIRVGCRGYGAKGTLLKDEYFHRNIKGALAAGVKAGAYFFSQALTVEEAVAEAELVIGELGSYEITYPVAVDIERVEGQVARQDALTKEKRTEVCLAFCKKIAEAGFIPMIYGDSETFSELLDAEALTEYDFWVCETEGDMSFPYEFAVWQYSHEGKVDGITGDTSLSISLKEW